MNQDLVVLCKLAGREEPWTHAGVGGELGLAASAVHRSLQRSGASGLWDGRSRRVNADALQELLVHGIRYLIPPRMLGPARGVATAWSAEPLRRILAGDADEPVVWAHAEGPLRGTAIEPIHPCVPDAALRDGVLHGRLALIDALRAGGPRVRREAAKALGDSLRARET
jgi:hypothetical protein